MIIKAILWRCCIEIYVISIKVNMKYIAKGKYSILFSVRNLYNPMKKGNIQIVQIKIFIISQIVSILNLMIVVGIFSANESSMIIKGPIFIGLTRYIGNINEIAIGFPLLYNFIIPLESPPFSKKESVLSDIL